MGEAGYTAYRSAAWAALAPFPIAVTALELVAISENITFRVIGAGSSGDFVLRLHRPGYNSLEELEAERCWTHALNQAGLRAPEGVQTTSGAYFCVVAVPGTGERRYAGLTRWIEGRPLSERLAEAVSSREAEEAFRDIGRLAAALHEHSRAWDPPPGFRRPRLDVAGLLGEAPRWGRFWEHPALDEDEQQHLLALRAEARTKLLAHGTASADFGLIHADLHADNILVHEDGVGVIDFDDAAFGWYLYDLATALVDARDQANHDALRAALLAGYAETRPLTEEDHAFLDVLVAVREMSLIGWLAGRPEHDDPAFLASLRERLRSRSRITDY